MIGPNSAVGVGWSTAATLPTSAGIGALDSSKVLDRSRHWRQRNVWFCFVGSHRFRQKLLVIERLLKFALFEFPLRNLRQVAHIAVEHKRPYLVDGQRRRRKVWLLCYARCPCRGREARSQ